MERPDHLEANAEMGDPAALYALDLEKQLKECRECCKAYYADWSASQETIEELGGADRDHYKKLAGERE